MRELTLESQELTRKAQEQALETRQAQLLMQINNHLNEEKFQNYLVELRQWQVKGIEELMDKLRKAIKGRIEYQQTTEMERRKKIKQGATK